MASVFAAVVTVAVPTLPPVSEITGLTFDTILPELIRALGFVAGAAIVLLVIRRLTAK